MMNKTREEAVWKRVMAESAQTPEPEQKPKQESCLTERQVMELLEQEAKDACTYQTLACRVKGEARRTLMQLSREEKEHYRKLEAVYYVMTGRRPSVDRPKAPCVACLNEELRRRYDMEIQGAALYHKLAQTAGSFAGVLHCLHHAEERHAKTVLCLLEKCL